LAAQFAHVEGDVVVLVDDVLRDLVLEAAERRAEPTRACLRSSERLSVSEPIADEALKQRKVGDLE
jgi:hypothetical protein